MEARRDVQLVVISLNILFAGVSRKIIWLTFVSSRLMLALRAMAILPSLPFAKSLVLLNLYKPREFIEPMKRTLISFARITTRDLVALLQAR